MHCTPTPNPAFVGKGYPYVYLGYTSLSPRFTLSAPQLQTTSDTPVSTICTSVDRFF